MEVMKTLHVVGFKNSGKTTLIARWVRLLKKEGLVGCGVETSWTWWTSLTYAGTYDGYDAVFRMGQMFQSSRAEERFNCLE